MSNQWQSLQINMDPLAGVAEKVKAFLDPAIEFLDVLVNIIEAAASIVAATNSLLQKTLDEIAGLLKSIIGDILYFGVSFCAHHNVTWDDTWTWGPVERNYTAKDPFNPDVKITNRNYLEKGDLPWTANGLTGWLSDVGASSYNRNNPNAPRTDSDDALNAFIFVLIFPDLPAFMQMPRSVKKFLESLNLKFITDTWERMDTSYGQSLVRLKSAFDDDLEEVVPTTQTSLEFPIWTTVSLGRVFGPAAENVFTQIDKIVSALKGFSDLSGIVVMLEGLAEKVLNLQQIIEDLDRLIEELVDLLLNLEDLASWIVVNSSSGGMNGVIEAALSADNFPSLGSGDSAVAGFCAVFSDAESAGENISSKFDKLLQIFGLSPNQEGSTFINNIEDATSQVITSSGPFTMEESNP